MRSLILLTLLSLLSFSPIVQAQETSGTEKEALGHQSVAEKNEASAKVLEVLDARLPSEGEVVNKIDGEDIEDPESSDASEIDSETEFEDEISEKISLEEREFYFQIGRLIRDARTKTKAFSDRKNRERQLSEIEEKEAQKAGPILDLAPRFKNVHWKNAMTAFTQKKCSSAKKFALKAISATPDLRKDPEFELAYATFESCAGQETVARETYTRLAKRTDAVGMAARVILGNELAASKTKIRSIKKQIEAFAETDDPKILKANLIKLDEFESQLKGRTNRRRARLTRVKILAKLGRVPEAKRGYLSLLRKTFGSRFNAKVNLAIRAFEKKHNVRILSYADNIDLMRSFIRRGKYGEAKQVSIKNAKKLKLSSKEIEGWMYYRQALEAEKKKKREIASELFSKANKIVTNKELRPRLYFGWARALRRLNKDDRAIGLYVKICKEYPKHHLCDDAMYEAGRLEQYASKHDTAISRFSEIIAIPSSEFIADALWRRGFSYYLKGEFEKSQIDFERLRSDFGHRKDASELSLGLKGSYWVAVSLQKGGKKEAAIDQYKTTLRKGPLTWYGRLAAARLKELGFASIDAGKPRMITKSEMKDFSTLGIPASTSLEPIALWIRLGFYKRAQSWVAGLSRSPKAEEGTMPLLCALNLHFGRADLAHWNMKRHISESGPNEENVRQWAVAFPNPYAKETLKYGKDAGVSPHLVQAIIRQESGFRPKVQSWAGAVGLMQLMPGTARYVANVFDKKEKYDRSQLTDINTNVRLGSMYIRLHTAFANDRIPLALAGYNAGPAPLKSWVKRYGDRELDAFVESITFREARGYVRKVYTSYITYSALYGETLPELNLKLPAGLRKWGTLPKPKISFYLRDYWTFES